MGSKIPKVVTARAAKAKAAMAKATKPDSTKSTESAPKVPPTPTVIPPTPTEDTFVDDSDDLPRADINMAISLIEWDGQGEFPVPPRRRAANERHTRAVLGRKILAQLDKLSKLKENRVYDAEEEEDVIDELERAMKEKLVNEDMDVVDPALGGKIARLMEDFKGKA